MKLKKMVLLTVLLTIVATLSLGARDVNILAYVDRGIKYYPRYVRKGHVKYGKASWYGKPFHGRKTANGERYNMYNMTAAHRTYAMGTLLKVTNLRNRRSVRVRINDRGPFYNTRNIDLSYGAARKLGMVNKGVGKVKIEVISSGSKKRKKRYSKKKIEKIKFEKEKREISNNLNDVNHIIVKSNKIERKKKIQIASFFNRTHAYSFKKKYKLKHSVIIKKYIASEKKMAYKVVVKCTPWEANHLLKSKKFLGAYLIS
jgi:rare lipoprotein A